MDRQTVSPNHFLSRLPDPVLARLLPAAQLAEYRHREAFIRSGEPVDTLRFPLSGMASMVSIDEQGATIEVATIGREGVVGVQALFRDLPSAFDMMWQLPGHAVVMGAADVRAAMEEQPELVAALSGYLASLFLQAAQNGACNRLHDLEQRAAKWLLLTDDRTHGDRLDLTQEFFSDMLGVTRPKLSLVESTFRTAGYIDQRRNGGVTIVDRAGLEELACGCYAIIRDELASLRVAAEHA